MAATHDMDAIARRVAELVKKYDERDPARLAQAMNILVARAPMGLSPGCCKGFFIRHHRIRHITVNSDLPPVLSRLVLAHELGHAVLHGSLAGPAAYQDRAFFDTADTAEYEANLFASELLLPDEEVMAVLNEDRFFFEAASILEVPPELLDFKFKILKRKGFRLESPIPARSDFLKSLEKTVTPQLLPAEDN